MTEPAATGSPTAAPRPSRIGLYSTIIAILALLGPLAGVGTLIYGIVGYKMGRFGIGPSLQTYLPNGANIAAYGAGVCLFVAIVFAALAKKGIRRSALVISVVGVVIGAVAAYIPYSFRQNAAGAPQIHDVTTDTDNPPQYVEALELRKATGARNTTEYKLEGGRGANKFNIPDAQHKAFPEIQPIILPGVTPADAFKRALEGVHKMKWHLIVANAEEGRIEAWDQTFWFRFIDDVAIRITPIENGSKIDVRSVSRIGGGDAGTNARRIRNYMAVLPKS